MLFRSEKRPVPGNDVHTGSSAPKRVLSAFMSVVLAITLAPFPAYAAPTDSSDGAIPAEEQSGSVQVAAGQPAVDASTPGAPAAEQATTEPAPSSDASAAEPEPTTAPATAAEAASDVSAGESAVAPATDASADEPAPAPAVSATEPEPATTPAPATAPAAPATAPAPAIDLDDESLFALAEGDTIWLVDAETNERVTTLHTAHRYKIAHASGMPTTYDRINFEDVTSYYVEYSETSGLTGYLPIFSEDGVTLDGLYSGWGSYDYDNVLSSGVYRFSYEAYDEETGSKKYKQEQLYRVISDGACDFAYGEADGVLGLRVFDYEKDKTDEAYDGATQYYDDGAGQWVVEYNTPSLDAVNQTDSYRLRMYLNASVDYADDVQLEELVLYKSDYTWDEVKVALDGESLPDEEQVDPEWWEWSTCTHLPTPTTFTDASHRIKVWSRTEDAETNPLAMRIVPDDQMVGYQYGAYLIIDKMDFSNIPLETGVYFLMARVLLNDSQEQTFVYRAIQITAAADAVRVDPTIVTTSVPAATKERPYEFSFEARSGATVAGDFTWELASGRLPEGLVLAADGTLAGTPTKAGTYAFTVKLTEDIAGAKRSSEHEFSLVVNDEISLGEIIYTPKTYWITKGSDYTVPVSVEVSGDLAQAGLSKSKASVGILHEYDDPDGTSQFEGVYTRASMELDGNTFTANPQLISHDPSIVNIKRIEVALELINDDGDPVTRRMTEQTANGTSEWDEPVVLRSVVENPDINLGGTVTMSPIDFTNIYGPEGYNEETGETVTWPADEARVRLWAADEQGNPIGAPRTRTAKTNTYGGAEFDLPPGNYVFTVEAQLDMSYEDEHGNWVEYYAYADILGDCENATRVAGTKPVRGLVTVEENRTTEVQITYTDAALSFHTADVLFETANGGLESNVTDYYVEWFRDVTGTGNPDDYVIVGMGNSVSLEKEDNPEAHPLYARVTPTGKDATSYKATGYIPVPEGQGEAHIIRAVVPRQKLLEVTATVSVATEWTPYSSNYPWGVIEVRRPLPAGDYESSDTWIYDTTTVLAGVTPGSIITFIPQVQSICGPVSYTVPDNLAEDPDPLLLNAAPAKGVISFDKFTFVRADDMSTSEDDDPASRTENLTLNDVGVDVQVYQKGTDTDIPVPFYIFADNSLVIDNSETPVAAGSQFDIEIKVQDTSMPRIFANMQGKEAATYTETVTLSGDDCSASLGNLVLESQGNAAVPYSNRNNQGVELLMYNNNSGLLVEDSTNYYFNSSDALHTPFMPSGTYKLYAVERDVMMEVRGGSSSYWSSYTNENYDTIAEFEAIINDLGAEASLLVSEPVTFTIQDNKTVVTDDLTFPVGTDAGIIDRSASHVSAASNYSDTLSISVVAQLAEDISLDSLQYAYLELYTNQPSGSEAAAGITNVKTLSMNGKGIPFSRWDENGGYDKGLFTYGTHSSGNMANGCLYINLEAAENAVAGAAAFPLRVSLAIPRTNVARTEVWAWLNVNGHRYLIGSYSQEHQEVTLTAPATAAWKQFWVYGETGADATVGIYLNGMRVATATADSLGYYTTEISLPSNVSDGAVYKLSAQATWRDPKDASKLLSGVSQVQEVEYTTSEAAVETITMLYQRKPYGPYQAVKVYDRGQLTAKYYSYYRAEVDSNTAEGDAHALYSWMVTLANPQAARHVKVNIPRIDGDVVLNTSKDMSLVIGQWIPRHDIYMVSTSDDELDAAEDTVAAGDEEASDDMEAADGNLILPRVPIVFGDSYSLVREALKKGNAWMSEPAYFSYAPNEVYATFDPVQTSYEKVVAEERFVGWTSNKFTDAEMLSFFDALNAGGYVNVVDSFTPDADGYLNVITPDASYFRSAEAGCVEENLVLGMGEAVGEGDVYDRLLMHHSVDTRDASSAEALGYIRTADALYAQAKDLDWSDTTLSYDTDGDGVSESVVVDVGASEDIGIPSWVYFIQTASSVEADDNGNNILGNCTVELMFKYELDDGSGYDYNLIRANKSKYTSIEWNEGTGQRITTTYEIYPGQVPNDDDDGFVKIGDLMYQWEAILSVLQLGYEDALSRMSLDQNVWPSIGVQDAADMTAQGAAFRRACLRPVGETNLQKAATWSGKAPRFNNDAQMSPAEARNMMNFLDDNKSGDMETESLFHADHLGGGTFNNAKWAFGARNLQELSDRVKEVTSAATDGPGKVAETGGKMLFKEGFKKRKKTYSAEYYDRMADLYKLGKETEKNGGKVNWNRFPKGLKAWFDYLDAKRKLAMGKGYFGKLDPSGFVYEGMLSNRVEGATVTLFTYNPKGGNAYMLDSNLFGVEPNPQVTGEDGAYQWFVPEGFWQVRVTKAGYDPVSTGDSEEFGVYATKDLDGDGFDDTTEWWMPVLPEQVDVNIPLYSIEPPDIKAVEADLQGVTITFTKPMVVESVDADMFAIAVGAGAGAVATSITPLDSEAAADGSDDILATKFRLPYPASVKLAEGENTVKVTLTDDAAASWSYADVNVADESIGVPHETKVEKPVETKPITLVDLGNVWIWLDNVNIVPFTTEINPDGESGGVPLADQMAISSQWWTSTDGSDIITATTPRAAKAGKTYGFAVTLSAKKGYKFVDDFEFIYGGNEVDTYEMSLGADGATLTLSGFIKNVATVDLKALKTAIAKASASPYTDPVTISADGKDVPPSKNWVTKAASDALSRALSNAKKVLDDPFATKAQVDAATKALNTAMAGYKPAPGTKGEVAPVVKRTVSFDANGGSGTMKSVQVADKSVYTLPKCTFTAPAGKEFDRWDKGAPGATIKVVANVTLKATWKDKAVPPKPEVDKAALEATIAKAAASPYTDEVATSTDGSDVPRAFKWITPAAKKAFEDALAAAKAVSANANATQKQVDDAKEALDKALAAYQPKAGTAIASWTRLAGPGALDTMAEIINAGNFEKGGTVVLASLEGYWDALTAAGIAGLEKAPVVMALQDQLGAKSAEAIAQLAPSKIIVCGGGYWIPDSVVAEAAAAAGIPLSAVTRLAGDNAALTAGQIADAGKGRWSDTAIVATAGTFQDALAAAPVSWAKAMPIFLAQFDFATETGYITPETIKSMKDAGISKCYIAGGTYWIPAQVKADLEKAGIEVLDQLMGPSAVETSAAIGELAVEKLGMSANNMGAANVAQHYDALASASFCGKNGSVLVLVLDENSSAIAGFAGKRATEIAHGYVFGGTGSVSDASMSALEAATK